MSESEFEEDDHDVEPRDLQKLLLKSFMVVVFCYTLFMTGMAVVLGVVFYEFFRAATDMEPDAFTKALAEDSANLFKRSRYLPFVALSVVWSFVMGCVIVRLAPFSKMVHAAILVLLVVATFFVFATGEETPAELQTVAMIMVPFGPIAIVIGARLTLGRSSVDAGFQPEEEE